MRERFVGEGKLLSETLNLKEISVFSTKFNRTLMSAAAHLQGLYPDGSGQKFEKV